MWSRRILSTTGGISIHRLHAAYSSSLRSVTTTACDIVNGGPPSANYLGTLRTTHIKPQRAIGTKECQLITFDLQCLAIDYIQRLFIYKNNTNKFEDVEEKLKDGLRAVLEGFYPLAGKIVRDEEGLLKLKYDDNMIGAEFKTVDAEETLVADMVDAEGSHGINFKEFIPYIGVSNYEGIHRALLAVQLTKLKDGFALGCGLNHAVVDGLSVWHFLKSWADKCKDPTHNPVTPFHDRTKARNTRVKVDFAHFDPQLTTATEPVISQKLFSFSESTIDNIKLSTAGSKPLSMFQCVAAHVWRAVTRARRLNPEDITILVTFANIRNRIDPPMPETYFGNLIQAAVTGTTAGDLYKNSPDTSATLIEQAIKALDSKAIEARVTKWERNPKPLKLADLGENIVGFGSSPKFKVHELDFGCGNPEMVRSGYGNRFDGMVFLHQGKHGGRSIDIDISLEDKAMKRLEMDKDFLMNGLRSRGILWC